MKNWEQFEQNCFNYLYKKYNKYAKFEIAGGSDSTVSDIRVITKTDEFFIEVKHVPSQCGQFVLIPDNDKKQFIFSHLNISHLTSNTQAIIDHMNKNFEEFLNAGTKGCDIIFDSCEKIFSNWIINYYKEKGTRYIITNDYIMLPISKFNSFFNVECAYRIKKSGSSSIGIKNKDTIIKYINSLKLKNYKCEYNNGHLNIFTSDKINKKTFDINDSTYMFSDRGYSYEVRKLSNTYNANVIFSIDLKDNVNGLSEQEIINIFSA